MKVLPREYGSQYSWNFIFQKGFWRKKQAVKHFPSTSRGNFLAENAFKPAVEAISLDMKQQELDGRFVLYNSRSSVMVLFDILC